MLNNIVTGLKREKGQNRFSQKFIKTVIGTLLLSFCFEPAVFAGPINTKSCRWHPGHYLRVGHENTPTSTNAAFFSGRSGKLFRGLQKTYTWRAMEPAPGRYNFSLIKSDLADLRRQNKRLVVEIYTKNFHYNPNVVGFNDNQPGFLKGSPKPGGGNYEAVYTSGHTRTPAYWDPAVAAKLRAFYRALGNELSRDPNVSALEAVNADETATSFARIEDLEKSGVMPYNRENYGRNMMEAFRALNNSLPHTVAIQYINYPTNLIAYFVDTCKMLGGGLGGPDLDPDLTYKKPRPLPTPPFFEKVAGEVPLGMAVQWGDTYKYETVNKRDKLPDDDRSDVIDTLRFAQKLGLNYIYWQGSYGPYKRIVEDVLSDSDIVNQSDPARGLIRRYPKSVSPYLER